MRRAVYSVFVLICVLIPAVAGGQVLIFESESGTAVPAGPCDLFHRPVTCEVVHWEGVVIPSIGATVQLSGQTYILEWMGPGYHLESGVIVQPYGDSAPGLKGQKWFEVYPQEGRIHTSRGWKDLDANRALSAFDTLALDSDPAVTVIDVRLQIRVRPAPAKPELPGEADPRPATR